MSSNFGALSAALAKHPYAFEIYRSGTQWRWRLKAGNGEIVASGEAYASKRGCEDAVGRIKSNAASAKVKHL